MRFSCRFAIAILLSVSNLGRAATSDNNPEWTQPFPAFRIVGNLYWVGTYDLATYLITTPQGHILINSGMKETVPQIAAGIEKLGFHMRDVKILTATHAHWDHVAGLAELKRMTGARVWMMAADADVLESGGRNDFRWGKSPDSWFDRVHVDRRLKDGDRVQLGAFAMTARLHAGHTKGATSFLFDVDENGRRYRVGIMNMGSINPGVRVSGMPTYPSIGADYSKTFRNQEQTQIDIFLASHASQFRLHEKYKPGDAYDPKRFVDPEGYLEEVRRLRALFEAQFLKEKGQGG